MEKSQLVTLGKTKLLFQSLLLLLYNGFIPKSANFQRKKGPRHIAWPPLDGRQADAQACTFAPQGSCPVDKRIFGSLQMHPFGPLAAEIKSNGLGLPSPLPITIQ